MHEGEPATVVLKYTVYEGAVFRYLGWGESEIEGYHDDEAHHRQQFAEAAREMVRENLGSAPDWEVWCDGLMMFTNV